ncbi:hypothetical protein CRENBAI_004080 [Crenichthys baileyi]|uniref:Uncharacterized protein n=1 Tax=Crenichthys baileyi TaxID=28760 RepID=A0AAV9SCH0_9TELE
MFPPTTDPADKRNADALDRWVERQKEAMRNLPTDLEVLPSPLLLEQMEREAAKHQRVREGCFVSKQARTFVCYSNVSQARYSKQGRTFVCHSKVSQACCSSAHAVFSPVF